MAPIKQPNPGKIRSHRDRVKHAKEIIATKSDLYGWTKVSIVDREAIVEWLLLEDLVALFRNRLTMYEERLKTDKTAYSRKSDAAFIDKYKALLLVVTAAKDVSRNLIMDGNFRPVSRAIPEHPLMVSAGSPRRIAELKDMALEILNDTYAAWKESLIIAKGLSEGVSDADINKANMTTIYELDEVKEEVNAALSEINLEEIDAAVNSAFGAPVEAKPKPKLN